MDRIEVVPGLEPELLERVVARLRELEPSTVAVLVTGSYARGTADEDSDLDVNVLTDGKPSSDYRMWFEERPGQKQLHVSPSVRSLTQSLAERDEPQDWALGFPVLNDVRYVWATDEARTLLGDPPSSVHPPAPPELEDFVEFLTKVRRASSRSHGAGIRAFAREAAVLAPGLSGHSTTTSPSVTGSKLSRQRCRCGSPPITTGKTSPCVSASFRRRTTRCATRHSDSVASSSRFSASESRMSMTSPTSPATSPMGRSSVTSDSPPIRVSACSR